MIIVDFFGGVGGNMIVFVFLEKWEYVIFIECDVFIFVCV